MTNDITFGSLISIPIQVSETIVREEPTIAPAVESQNLFEEVRALKAMVSSLNEKINSLNEKINSLEQENAELRNQLKQKRVISWSRLLVWIGVSELPHKLMCKMRCSPPPYSTDEPPQYYSVTAIRPFSSSLKKQNHGLFFSLDLNRRVGGLRLTVESQPLSRCLLE